MKKYVWKRLLQLIPILFVITFLSFGMMRLAGSDAVMQKMENTGQAVSQEVIDSAREELQVLLSALDDILDLTIRSFQAADMETARRVEPLEETIDQLIEEIRSRHIQRLQAGQCTIQLGFVLNDLLTNLERVSDHCSNIAVSVIEECSGGPGRHAYLQEVKAGGAFGEDLRRDRKKYHLPEA